MPISCIDEGRRNNQSEEATVLKGDPKVKIIEKGTEIGESVIIKMILKKGANKWSEDLVKIKGGAC